MGEAELDTEQDFSRAGRVNAMLARRLELLAEVEKMARQLAVVSGAGGRGSRGRGACSASRKLGAGQARQNVGMK